MPICTVFQASVVAYEKYGVHKATVECAHFVSVEDIRKIDEQQGEPPKNG